MCVKIKQIVLLFIGQRECLSLTDILVLMYEDEHIHIFKLYAK